MKKLIFSLLVVLFALSTARADAPIHVYLIGDSTCATKDLKKQNPERGWGHMFQPLFDGGVVISNHATNGRSTKSFRAEGRWQRVYESLQAGDYVFIQFGHNDAKVSDTTRYASPAQYAENLRRYVRESRDKGAIPVLLTPLMRRHFVDGRLTDTHGDYPDAMRRVAHEEGVLLLDMQAVTRDWLTALGDEASKSYFMWVAPGTNPLHPDGRKDDTHLNAQGARIVARQVAAQIAATLPALAAHLDIPDIAVAQDGSGDFFTLTEAVAALPDFGRDTLRIRIMPGTYREKVVIPATKRHVRLEGVGAVTIRWDDFAAETSWLGTPLGTSGSSTVYFGGDDWQVRHITFENGAGRVGQAVAVQTLGTDICFYDCRFVGNQDTLYLYGGGNRDGECVAENTRLYFENCYVEGTTDFIFGAASALFYRCEIRSKSDSYITAASTCRGMRCGLVFAECRLTADDGVERCYLGRPWRNYAQTLFVDCEMGAHIRPEGWHDWSKPAARKTARYAECGSTGEGGGVSRRVRWSRIATSREVARALAEFDDMRK